MRKIGVIIFSILFILLILLCSIKVKLNRAREDYKDRSKGNFFAQDIDEYYDSTWAEFIKGHEVIGNEDNIEVHIKTQEDLENYLLKTGNDLSGDMIWFENDENIYFPTGTYTFKSRAEFYLPAAKGDIDFNNSTFVLGGKTILFTVALGDQGDRVYKNLTVYGNASVEITMENNTAKGFKYTGYGYNFKAIKASNLHFENLEFNNSKMANSHLFDIMGSTNFTFNNITNRGDIENWSANELKTIYDYSDHLLYSEMIQIDMTSTGSPGTKEFLSKDFNSILDIYNLIGDNIPSKNISITNIHSSSYSGYSGQGIIDKTYSKVTKPYAATIGAHGVDNEPYTGIKLSDNYFENVVNVKGVKNKLMAPIHFVVASPSARSKASKTPLNELKELLKNDETWKNTDITSSNNTFINCSNEYDDADNPGKKLDTSVFLADFGKNKNTVTKVNLVDEEGKVFKSYNGYYPEEAIVDNNIYVSSSYENGVLTRKYRKPRNKVIRYEINCDENNNFLRNVIGYEFKEKKTISETVEELINGDTVTVLHITNIYIRPIPFILTNTFSIIINIALLVVTICIMVAALLIFRKIER